MKMYAAFCLLVILLIDSRSAHGAISCNVSSPGINTSYSGTLSINQAGVKSAAKADCW